MAVLLKFIGLAGLPLAIIIVNLTCGMIYLLPQYFQTIPVEMRPEMKRFLIKKLAVLIGSGVVGEVLGWLSISLSDWFTFFGVSFVYLVVALVFFSICDRSFFSVLSGGMVTMKNNLWKRR